MTSSPHYPQSNGKAENAVKTVKRLLTKCKLSGQSEIHALLDWRNTPSESIGTSPAQRFLGRRCTIISSKLKPEFPTHNNVQAQKKHRSRQQAYYNQRAKELKPISKGQTVRIRLPEKSTWSTGICQGLVGPEAI